MIRISNCFCFQIKRVKKTLLFELNDWGKNSFCFCSLTSPLQIFLNTFDSDLFSSPENDWNKLRFCLKFGAKIDLNSKYVWLEFPIDFVFRQNESRDSGRWGGGGGRRQQLEQRRNIRLRRGHAGQLKMSEQIFLLFYNKLKII